MNSKKTMKRKIENENRSFKEKWELEYFVINNNGKIQCVICLQIINVCKEYNVKRHYSTIHEKKMSKYEGTARAVIFEDFKKKMKHQTNLFSQLPVKQTASLTASYCVSLELAKNMKAFRDGEIVKRCAIIMAETFGEHSFGQKLKNVSLSHQTVSRRVQNMGQQITNKISESFKKSSYFSLCLDESVDQTDTCQLLVFIRMIFDDFSIQEEVLDLRPLKGNTRGEDIFKEVNQVVQDRGGFEKCSCIVTDGAPSMKGEGKGLVGFLRKNDVSCPVFHCIIHQEALCGKSIKQSDTMKTVVQVTNKIRGGNKAQLHCKFRDYLSEVEAQYGDLHLHSNVRWLSAGKCLKNFFGLRKEIPLFLKNNCKEYEDVKVVEDPAFLKQLAFMADLTQHLSDLNLKLQIQKQTISELVGHINGFRCKLKILNTNLKKNELVHFPCCQELKNELEDVEFADFCHNMDILIQEFESRFIDFDKLKAELHLYNDPLGVSIEEQPSKFQLELCDLQSDPFLQTRNERGSEFFKLLNADRFRQLRDFGLKITSMFGSTYMCERTFSKMKFIKNKHRTGLSNESLKHLLTLSTTNIQVDIPALVRDADNSQGFH